MYSYFNSLSTKLIFFLENWVSIPKWLQIALSLPSLSRWSFSLLISHKATSSQIRGCESKALIISPCVSFRISSASMASLSEVVTLRFFFAAKREKKEATCLEVKNSSIVNTRLPISSLTLLVCWATSSAFKFLPLFSPPHPPFKLFREVCLLSITELRFGFLLCKYPSLFGDFVVLLLQKNASWCFRRHYSILHFQSPSVTLFGPVNQSNLFLILPVTAIQHVIPYLWNAWWHPSSGHMRSFCSFFYLRILNFLSGVWVGFNIAFGITFNQQLFMNWDKIFHIGVCLSPFEIRLPWNWKRQEQYLDTPIRYSGYSPKYLRETKYVIRQASFYFEWNMSFTPLHIISASGEVTGENTSWQ